MNLTSKGGIAKAANIRAAYIANPNLCLNCDSPILPKEGVLLTETRRKRFCNRSCAAAYNNAKSPKRKPDTLNCEGCQASLVRTKMPCGNLNRGRFCADCLRGLAAKRIGVEIIENRTKGDLFSNRKAYQSARSTIRRHAKQNFLKTNRPLSCENCGYDKHAEICHIRSVADFPNEATISEINANGNLISLCPNCHWEFDSGLLTFQVVKVQE